MLKTFQGLYSQIESRLTHKHLIHDKSILTRWASVNLILHYSGLEQDCWRLAMIRRADNENDPWSGHYAFPGGKVELGEDHCEAALRETHEEVGLKILSKDSLGPFYSFQIKVKERPVNFGISSNLTLLTGELPLLVPEPNEVDQAFWFKLTDLLNPENITRENFNGYSGNFCRPCIKFDGHTIWGISYSILRELIIQLSNLEVSKGLVLDPEILPKV